MQTPAGVPAETTVDLQRAQIEAATVASAPTALAPAAVTASSSEIANGAANAVDGRSDTRWAALGQGQYIQLDFGGERYIGSVNLAWFLGQSRRYTFQLQTSVDGSRFTDIGGRRTNSGVAATDQVPVAANGRFLRVVGYGNTGSGDWVSLNEVAAFGSLAPVPSAPVEQVPMGVKASSSQTGNGPLNAIDNRLDTRWAANGQGQYLQFDLGGPKAISAVSLAWYRGDARTYSYQLQVSDDGLAFRDVGGSRTSSGTSATLQSIAVATQGRYLRVVGYGNSEGTSWMSLYELKVFGSDAPTSNPSPTPQSSVGSATLSWTMTTQNADGTPLRDLNGYAIYYGTSASNLMVRQTISGSSTHSITLSNLDLTNSRTYYFAVSALYSNGRESARTPVVSKSF